LTPQRGGVPEILMTCNEAIPVKRELCAAGYVESMLTHVSRKPPGNNSFGTTAHFRLDRKARGFNALEHMLKDRPDRGDSANVVKRVAEARLPRVILVQMCE